jgi:tetratricopeptide (TPR) repeat protein
MRRWFRLFVTLRNGTRAHGATPPTKAGEVAPILADSIKLIYDNFCLFQRPWAYLHQNLSGKYRISPVSATISDFDFLKQRQTLQLPDGVYVFWGGPRRIGLLQSNSDLQDFYFPNGGMKGKTFELLSYYTDDKVEGDASAFMAPPGTLPASETEGHGELVARENCFSNVPDVRRDYISRTQLEMDVKALLLDDKRPIVTLVGRGGIGKTSLALKVIHDIHKATRYDVVVWLSARDVDLQLSGPKPVRPLVLTQDDISRFYAGLVLPEEDLLAKGFNARTFFETQLQESNIGPCLFVFDNFETTRNPIEMFNWIDAYIRHPNKALITTRLRDFKGDYPIEVQGMDENEARLLIAQTASTLGIQSYLNDNYIGQLISQSEGHPYIIRILLGEVAKAKRAADIPRLVAGSEDILTALFERTYAALSPCAQRAFLTLAAWNSAVPRLALEAVLYRSTSERREVETGIESLLQFSMAEILVAPTDEQEFIGLPLVASVFGRKKLNVSVWKAAIQADVEILQMLGPSRRDDIHLGLAKKLERFISNISTRIEQGESYETFGPILEMICRTYNPGWLMLARWHMEFRTTDGYCKAIEELRRFLENAPTGEEAARAWEMLGHACYQIGDSIGEIHAFVERAHLGNVDFYHLSNLANKINQLSKIHGAEVDREQKRDLAERLAAILHSRKDEADATDLSRMAWLAVYLGQTTRACEYVTSGKALDPDNYHLINLSRHLGLPD